MLAEGASAVPQLDGAGLGACAEADGAADGAAEGAADGAEDWARGAGLSIRMDGICPLPCACIGKATVGVCPVPMADWALGSAGLPFQVGGRGLMPTALVPTGGCGARPGRGGRETPLSLEETPLSLSLEWDAALPQIDGAAESDAPSIESPPATEVSPPATADAALPQIDGAAESDAPGAGGLEEGGGAAPVIPILCVCLSVCLVCCLMWRRCAGGGDQAQEKKEANESRRGG